MSQDLDISEDKTVAQNDSTAGKDRAAAVADVTAAPDMTATLLVATEAIAGQGQVLIVVIVTAVTGILIVEARVAAAVGAEVKAEVVRLGLVAFYWLFIAVVIYSVTVFLFRVKRYVDKYVFNQFFNGCPPFATKFQPWPVIGNDRKLFQAFALAG